MEKVAVKMTSMESIGTCSLDVDATASDVSGTADGRASSVSQHSLLSKSSAEVHHDPTRVTQEVHDVLEKHPHLPIGSDQDIPTRQPSYVNISCSVSGYTSFSRYGAKVREGQSDHSPGAVTLGGVVGGGSLASSDLADWGTKAQPSKSDKSMYLTVFQTQKVLQVSGGSTANLRTQFCSEELRRNSGGDTIGSARLQVNGEAAATFSKSDHTLDQKVHGSSKSLVQQRIECLYGPNALTKGLLVNRARPKEGRRRLQPDGGVGGGEATSDGVLAVGKAHEGSGSGVTNGVSSQHDAELRLTKSGVCRQLDSPYLNGHQHEDQVDASHRPITTVTTVTSLDNITLQDRDTSYADTTKQVESSPVDKDGHYFLKVMGAEEEKIKNLIGQGELRLSSGHFTEEVAGRYRSAIGKANLLLAQKFQQFQRLCDKNIYQLPDDPLQTMSSDLEGFWDTIFIQVNDIYTMFQELESSLDSSKTTAGTPTETDGEMKDRVKASKTANGVKQKRHASKIPTIAGGTQRSEKAEAAARAREDARKKLAEMKRKARCQLTTQQAADDQEVEIFIPPSRQPK